MSSKSEWVREQAAQRELRRLTGLWGYQGLHPAPEPFYTQAEALARLNELVQSGEYTANQVNLFAEELGSTGKRRFRVDTFAGFALDATPVFSKDGSFAGFGADNSREGFRGHLYEVILEDRPCWLYFDLEYSRVSNPDLSPEAVMEAFRATLSSFCAEVLGAQLEESSVIELESSTPQKFSKHVIVHRLVSSGGVDDTKPQCTQHAGADAAAPVDNSAASSGAAVVESVAKKPRLDGTIEASAADAHSAGSNRYLAFANNAQAGLLVSELLAYAQARRHVTGSPASLLFMRAPPSSAASASGGGAESPENEREVPLIDESVYSRNRSFRLLFHAKFGKQASLRLSAGRARAAFSRCEYPPIQLLRTMASFVPDGTLLFRHPLIPQDFGHSALKVNRVGFDRPQKARDGGSRSGGDRDIPDVSSSLLEYLVTTWDAVRQAHEPQKSSARARATVVESVVEVSKRYLAVTLSHNNFCFCKGSSHKSNHIYLVVDQETCAFRQKCHDVDCRQYCSPPYPLPPWLIETEEEKAMWADLEEICGKATAQPS